MESILYVDSSTPYQNRLLRELRDLYLITPAYTEHDALAYLKNGSGFKMVAVNPDTMGISCVARVRSEYRGFLVGVTCHAELLNVLEDFPYHCNAVSMLVDLPERIARAIEELEEQ